MWRSALTLVAAFLSFCGLLGALSPFLPRAALGPVGLALLTVLGAISLRAAIGLARSTARPGAARVEDGALVLRRGTEERRIAATALHGGAVEPVGSAHRVTLRAPREEIRIDFPAGEQAEHDADALVETLGLGPARRTFEFRPHGLAERGIVRGLGLVAGVLLATGLTVVLALALKAVAVPLVVAKAIGLVAAAALGGAGVALAPRVLPVVTVGLDGLMVHSLFGRALSPYASIQAVERKTEALVHQYPPQERTTVQARLRDGSVTTLASLAHWKGQPVPQVDALLRRIDQARSAFEARRGSAELAVLDRAERSIAQWRTDLSESAHRSGFRNAALPRERLLEVLDDPSAPAERRVGAALAMRAQGDTPDARARIRVAADTCADPRLRVSLEAAADEEIDERLLERELGKASAPGS